MGAERVRNCVYVDALRSTREGEASIAGTRDLGRPGRAASEPEDNSCVLSGAVCVTVARRWGM